jgi:hypothetical protein
MATTMHPLKNTAMFARGARLTGATLAAALLAACSSERLLKADRPDQIAPGALAGSLQGAAALYAGALGDLTVAIAGGNGGGAGIGMIGATGYLSDEFQFGATPPELREMDLRNVREQNGAWLQTYIDQHRARASADRAAAGLKAAGSTDGRQAEMLALSGLINLVLAESYCSGAPLSTAEPDIVYGDPQTTTQLMQGAAAKMDAALAATGADARARNLANLLKGRALLGQGQFAAAAAAVASVPTSFDYRFQHGTATPRQQSFLFNYSYNVQGLLVGNNEGGNGLNFGTANDPRVPVDGTGAPSVFDQRTPAWFFKQFNAFGHTIKIASGVEARLIEAEAALQAGSTALWLQKLGEARAPFNMSAPADPGTAAARVNLMFRERAFALFGQARRVGDLRRMVRQYQRGAETVFPTGPYHKDNLTRGGDVNIIIPISEKNNAKFTGCLNRSA